MISESPDNHDTDLTTTTGQPAWRVALFYPRQGSWTEADYLGLDGGPLVEFENGAIEVLDMPSKEHQRIVQFLYRWLFQFVSTANLGEVFIAPLPVRLWQEKYREPDVVFVRSGRQEHLGYPDGADLVIEVVSPDRESRRRDNVIKRSEYARAKIAEYWIVDPEQQLIEVLVCDQVSQTYRQHGIFVAEQTATSAMFSELAVGVDQVLTAGKLSP